MNVADGTDSSTSMNDCQPVEWSAFDKKGLIASTRCSPRSRDDIRFQEQPEAYKSQDLSTAWWQDPNTPFKTWARAYAQIKQLDGVLGSTEGPQVLNTRRKDVNVLGWTL